MSEMDNKEVQPVTVLGITFENEAKRREYFREELRKKLPELRNVEGFPIGSDDDIINLSDPPYYTACPNPWLNDFIELWEEEKKELQREGKRKADFEVKEPYASDVSEGKSGPIYMAHSYHTKCPHSAIMRYILHYTQPGDVIFDGFCGTGMTGVAANMCGNPADVAQLGVSNAKVGVRKSICSDLSPIASIISASYNLPFDKNVFEKKALDVLKTIDKELGWLFTSENKNKITSTIWSDVFICPNCGEEIVLWDNAVNVMNKSISDHFACQKCGFDCTKKTMDKAFETVYDPILGEHVSWTKKVAVRSECDREGTIINPIIDNDRIISAFGNYAKTIFPSRRMPEGDEARRNDKDGITHVHHFYTWRSLLYLAKVYDLVKSDVHLLAWFTSTLMSTTKMNRFRFSGTGINSGTLYIPSLSLEFTPSSTLKRKIQAFVSTWYANRGNCIVGIASATDLQTVPSNSCDYMFIDPPFGANLMYSELSAIWEGWIKLETNTKEEAIINNTQGKGLFEYQQLMNNSLREFYRILKPGKWLTMEFSNTSASVWNSIQNALQGVGFVVANVAGLDKKQGSFKAVTTTTAVKQDLVITCYKPSDELSDKMRDYSKNADNVWDFIDEYLLHLPVHLERNNATTTVVERSPKILFDRLISYYVVKGYPVPLDASDFQVGLRERYVERDGMFFTASQAVEYDKKKKLAPEFVPMGIIVSDEANGIQWLKNLLQNGAKTYQEIQPEWMQAINGTRKNDIIPELKQILEENFIEDKGGKWRMPNIQDDKDVDALRTKSLLREFKIYVETAKKPKGKIKEARVEALRAGFKQCYIDKDFQTIVTVGDKIPQNLLTEDEVLLQFYDIAQNKL